MKDDDIKDLKGRIFDVRTMYYRCLRCDEYYQPEVVEGGYVSYYYNYVASRKNVRRMYL